jgi:hypothetical protein
VVVLLRERLPRLAARPVLAAQTGARQADNRAGRDDQPECDHGGARESPERDRRELEGAQAREPCRLDVHLHDGHVRAVLSAADPADEEVPCLELGDERSALV